MIQTYKKRLKAMCWYLVATLIALTTVYPFLWMLATSFKTEKEIFTNSLSLFVENLTFENYTKVFERIPFLRYFTNSLILAIGGVITNLFFGSLAGYTFAKLRFRGRKAIFAVFLASMMVPATCTMIPSFLVLKHFPLMGGNDIWGQGGNGLINTYWAILLPGAAGAYAIFFMKQFFETLPTELADAARIDGCGEFGIFRRIYLPLVKPAALTLGIQTFQSGWNSFMWPMIVLNSQEMMTIQVGLSAFQYNYSTDYGPLMAGTVIATLPTLLFFISVQKYYVEGIAFSGGK